MATLWGICGRTYILLRGTSSQIMGSDSTKRVCQAARLQMNQRDVPGGISPNSPPKAVIETAVVESAEAQGNRLRTESSNTKIGGLAHPERERGVN